MFGRWEGVYWKDRDKIGIKPSICKIGKGRKSGFFLGGGGCLTNTTRVLLVHIHIISYKYLIKVKKYTYNVQVKNIGKNTVDSAIIHFLTHLDITK